MISKFEKLFLVSKQAVQEMRDRYNFAKKNAVQEKRSEGGHGGKSVTYRRSDELSSYGHGGKANLLSVHPTPRRSAA